MKEPCNLNVPNVIAAQYDVITRKNSELTSVLTSESPFYIKLPDFCLIRLKHVFQTN
jgi:hypothetical protein